MSLNRNVNMANGFDTAKSYRSVLSRSIGQVRGHCIQVCYILLIKCYEIHIIVSGVSISPSGSAAVGRASGVNVTSLIASVGVNMDIYEDCRL